MLLQHPCAPCVYFRCRVVPRAWLAPVAVGRRLICATAPYHTLFVRVADDDFDRTASALFKLFAGVPTSSQPLLRVSGVKFRRLCALAGILPPDTVVDTLVLLTDGASGGSSSGLQSTPILTSSSSSSSDPASSHTLAPAQRRLTVRVCMSVCLCVCVSVCLRVCVSVCLFCRSAASGHCSIWHCRWWVVFTVTAIYSPKITMTASYQVPYVRTPFDLELSPTISFTLEVVAGQFLFVHLTPLEGHIGACLSRSSPQR